MSQNYRQAKRGGGFEIIPWDYGDGFVAQFGLEGIAASTPYVLVDLSDTTRFPHDATQEIIVKSIRLHAEKATDGVYDIWIGVITELDATNGSADWFHTFHLEASGNPTDSTDRFAQQVVFQSGLNTQISGGSPTYFITNQRQSGNTNWQNDEYLTCPAGTIQPGVGDIVAWVEEVSGTGTIDFGIGIDYDAQ